MRHTLGTEFPELLEPVCHLRDDQGSYASELNFVVPTLEVVENGTTVVSISDHSSQSRALQRQWSVLVPLVSALLKASRYPIWQCLRLPVLDLARILEAHWLWLRYQARCMKGQVHWLQHRQVADFLIHLVHEQTQ